MATYPSAVYEPRTKNNKEGVVYDAEEDTTLFAEDVTKDDDEIVAIETELGTNPKGAKADVKTRLNDVDTAIGTKISKTIAGELDAMDELESMIDDDNFLVEDSEDDNSKKKVIWSTMVDAIQSLFNNVYLALAGGTLAGDILFGENTALQLDSALSADGKFCGITEAGTAGDALVFGDLCYFNNGDSRWEKTDANVADGYDKKLGICVLAAAGNGSATKMLFYGKIRADGAFPTLTIGAPVYMAEAVGDVVVAQPTTADVCIRIIGFGNTANELFFNPSDDYMVHA